MPIFYNEDGNKKLHNIKKAMKIYLETIYLWKEHFTALISF